MRNITSADNLLAFLRCTASEYQPKGAANTQHSEEAPAGKVCYARHPEVLQLPQSFDADLHRCISGHQSLQTDQAEEHGAILYPLNSLHDPVHPLIGRPLNEACNSLELGETFSYAEPETEPNQPRFVRARSPVIPARGAWVLVMYSHGIHEGFTAGARPIHSSFVAGMWRCGPFTAAL